MSGNSFLVRAESVDSAEAIVLLREYLDELISRYWGRAATEDEIDAEVEESPSEDLAAPHGRFLILREGPDALGCVGLRSLTPDIVELRRMFVRHEARRRGAGRCLIGAARDAGRELGARAIRLDTRNDLVEARTLYAACGFVEISNYNRASYAEHWFELAL